MILIKKLNSLNLRPIIKLKKVFRLKNLLYRLMIFYD
jgi:hypothetical protein